MSNSKALSELGAQDRARLEALLVEFDAAWTPDRFATTVEKLPSDSSIRSTALRELVKIDLERHARRGQPVPVEDYLRRFPELRDGGAMTADLLEAAAIAETDRACDASSATGMADSTLTSPFGRYRIVRKLGKGAMGSVYLAQDSKLDRLVALKVPSLPPSDEVAAERFAREARAAATIEHPGICRIYDVGQIGDRPYLTMAFIDGPSLTDELRSGPIAPRRAAALARDTALALAEAHRHGVIHRDLKPANILIGQNGQPVVVDFGLARSAKDDRRLTAEGEVIGTPLYMSPEQIQGDSARIGPATDIYALGAVLYELLAGRAPFVGSRSDVFQQALTIEPRPPSVLRSEIDARLDATVLRALRKRPGERFADMAEFAAAIDDWLKGDENPLPGRRWQWWLAGALALVLLLSLALWFAR
jgi:predicted Ser/Thr protein kinase